MRNMIKKVIVPALVIVVLFAVLRPLCIQDGKCNYLLLLLLMGIPFGIGKMCVWMVPRGFDLGGTLNYSHIEYVLFCLNRNTTKVGNIKAYLLTALYNAPATINSYYQAEVNHDMYGG